MGEDDEPTPSSPNYTTAFGEGGAHRVLEERPILDATVAFPGLVLHRFASLGRKRIVRIEGSRNNG